MLKVFSVYCMLRCVFNCAVLLGLGLVQPTAYAADVRVAVAANFAGPLRHIAPAFEAATGHKLVIIAGSSGKLFAQIHQGAPFDVFLSADSQKPQALAHMGLTPMPFTYVQGQLIIAGQLLKGLPNEQTALVAALKESTVTVAIANPKLAPYGAAAEQVLTHLGVTGGASPPRLIYADDVTQVAHYVSTGVVDAGFMSAAQQPIQGLVSWPVTTQWHAPIVQQGVILRASPAATDFVEYLQSAAVQAQLRSMGYLAPSEL